MKHAIAVMITLFKHLRFILFYPKIGPDMYLTHWLLFFKPLRILFQNKKIYKIGKNSDVRPYCTIIGTNNIIIGENVIIPGWTTLVADPSDNTAKIIIEDDVLFGPNVSIYSSTHKYADITTPIKYQGCINQTTIIKRGSWLGANAVILPGVTIGFNSVVGANSVVTSNIPDFSVAVGTPARIIKQLC